MREPLIIHYIQYGVAGNGETGYRLDRNVVAACEIAGIAVLEAKGPSRIKEIAYKRFHVMAILRSWGRSLPQIGRALNRHHTTILNGLRQWDVAESNLTAYSPRPDMPSEENVNWDAKRGKWVVRLWSSGARYIGTYSDFDAAIAARNAAQEVAG